LPQVLRRRHAPDRREPTRRGLLGAHLDGHDRTLSPGNAPAIIGAMSRDSEDRRVGAAGYASIIAAASAITPGVRAAPYG